VPTKTRYLPTQTKKMPTPVYISDRPADSDTLGRDHFAKSLAHSLLFVNAGDGLVVGIEGSWGTGKSTVIGFVKKQLLEGDDTGLKPIIVDFNPWMVSNTGALVEALITQIAASIHLDTRSPEKSIKAGQKLFGYIGLLKHLKYFKYVPGVSWFGNIAEDTAEMAGTVGDGVKAAQDALADMEKILPTFDLARRKAEVVQALRELDRPIVVIIDDLDRLPADEIRLTVQAIKAVADFPRTTYLLAYDREIVAKALGNGDPATGLSYLEKIVQVAYPIPPLFQHQLRNFADKKVKELLTMLSLNLRDYESANYTKAIKLVADLARHPRDIVRLMNRLILSLPATRNEVNSVDVIVFEALSQRFPSVRDSVHRQPTDFIGQAFRGDLDNEETEIDWADWARLESERENDVPRWEKHLPVNESERAVAKRVFAFLFPTASANSHNAPEDELRMADPDRLARYFRMTSLDNVPEAREIHDVLEKPDALATMLDNADGPELIYLLEWIFNYAPSCPDPDTYGSIDKLINAATNAGSSAELTSDLASLFAKVLDRLLRGSPKDERSECFNLIVTKAPLSISETILLEAAAEQGKWNVRPEMIKSEQTQIVADGEVVDVAIKTWSNRVRESIQHGTLSNEARMHAILYRFAQLSFAYEETYVAVTKICSTEDGLRKFLSVHVAESPFNSMDNFALVEDAQVLADRIAASKLKEEYAWLGELIVSDEFANKIRNQAARLKVIKSLYRSDQTSS
jgi:predicted KAP-like P-loop ATPase